MYYEINVALKGQHYFATAPHSLRDRAPAEMALYDFRRRFPVEEGFTVTCTERSLVGRQMDW